MPPILAANSDPFVNESSATEPDELVTEDDDYQDSYGEAIDISDDDDGNNAIVNISAAEKKFAGEVSSCASSLLVFDLHVILATCIV